MTTDKRGAISAYALQIQIQQRLEQEHDWTLAQIARARERLLASRGEAGSVARLGRSGQPCAAAGGD